MSHAGTSQLHCVVVTPETTLFDQEVDFVALPLYDGELGVLPGRAPLIGRLGYGELRTEAQGTTRSYFVEGGFAQVRDDVVTVLTHRAIPAERIDAQAAADELRQAQERRAVTEAEVDEKTRAVDRARAQIRIAEARV
ncbi:MAG TPA: ATP synthase F1 subunit epsilon [Isosphaeraceae bacterium]|jgi:F-type H+-transporting ATPase subunit epsilon|nr:ATP synthase F1 subunit epsilon [Isosphaeraceae bacterium]